MHVDRIGKEYITQEISKIIGNNKQVNSNVIILGFQIRETNKEDLNPKAAVITK